MLARVVGSAVALVVAASAFYVVVSYTHAFWHHRRGASVRQLVRAALYELGACLLLLPLWPLWLLLGASYGAVHEGEGEARGRRHPVVLLHGFAMNRTNWFWLGRRLVGAGVGPLYGTSYFSLQSVERSARALGRFVDRVCARERSARVDIVAHSLGGLVARYFIERLGGAARVGRLVTLGGPHHGTAFARLGPYIPSARESLVDSDLCASLWPPQCGQVRYTSIWSRADAIVEPPESASIAPYGEDCSFDDLGHVSLLLSRRVADLIAARLGA